MDALQGVSAGDAEALKKAFNIKTVRDLANSKYVQWAQASRTWRASFGALCGAGRQMTPGPASFLLHRRDPFDDAERRVGGDSARTRAWGTRGGGMDSSAAACFVAIVSVAVTVRSSHFPSCPTALRSPVMTAVAPAPTLPQFVGRCSTRRGVSALIAASTEATMKSAQSRGGRVGQQALVVPHHTAILIGATLRIWTGGRWGTPTPTRRCENRVLGRGEVDMPATPFSAGPNTLPTQPTSFIGRTREMEELVALLAATRLLTLTGPGGCGKTRLAWQVAATVRASFPDGIWWVELASLTDPALVPQGSLPCSGYRNIRSAH